MRIELQNLSCGTVRRGACGATIGLPHPIPGASVKNMVQARVNSHTQPYALVNLAYRSDGASCYGDLAMHQKALEFSVNLHRLSRRRTYGVHAPENDYQT
ncbi:hypothetical protein AAII07_50070 [Microvirga sp. 0TCS3.31]